MSIRRLHNKLLALFLLVSIGFFFVAPTAFAATATCFCYYSHTDGDGGHYCNAREGVLTTEECAYTCGAIFGDTYLSHDFAEETDTASVESFSQECARFINPASVAPTTTPEATPEPEIEWQTPELSVVLDPDFEFSPITEINDQLNVNYLAEYIAMAYRYLLGIATMVATVLIMVRGAQYALSAGATDASKATKGIKNAVVGLVLLMSTVTILYITNPEAALLGALQIKNVGPEDLQVYNDTLGPGGINQRFSADLASMDPVCLDIWQSAQNQGNCEITGIYSPTGNGPSCGAHHWFDYDKNYNKQTKSGGGGDWKQIAAMDWNAPFDAPLLAPFSGTATFSANQDSTSTCGNSIQLRSDENPTGFITICHVKDFTNENYLFTSEADGTRRVQAGEVIGHIGGNCCLGQTPPGGMGTCDKGTMNGQNYPTPCGSPYVYDSVCECQDSQGAGNTTGAHVHISWHNQTTHQLLKCMVDWIPSASSTGGSGVLLP